jgi:hypothetical protein
MGTAINLPGLWKRVYRHSMATEAQILRTVIGLLIFKRTSPAQTELLRRMSSYAETSYKPDKYLFYLFWGLSL